MTRDKAFGSLECGVVQLLFLILCRCYTGDFKKHSLEVGAADATVVGDGLVGPFGVGVERAFRLLDAQCGDPAGIRGVALRLDPGRQQILRQLHLLCGARLGGAAMQMPAFGNPFFDGFICSL